MALSRQFIRLSRQVYIAQRSLNVFSNCRTLKLPTLPKLEVTEHVRYCSTCPRLSADLGLKTAENKDTDSPKIEKQELAKIKSRLYLSFTCTVCDGGNAYTISKQAYTEGVVIVTCSSCKNNHLIADNLGWFEDIKQKNIEEIMEAKGENVKKFLSSDVKEFTSES